MVHCEQCLLTSSAQVQWHFSIRLLHNYVIYKGFVNVISDSRNNEYLTVTNGHDTYDSIIWCTGDLTVFLILCRILHKNVTIWPQQGSSMFWLFILQNNRQTKTNYSFSLELSILTFQHTPVIPFLLVERKHVMMTLQVELGWISYSCTVVKLS